MTFGSLFAGIGGFDLGLERAGMRCVWQVEINEFCRRVLIKHWPDVPKHDDVRTFPPSAIGGGCDVICGGFPCQDISNAGKRAGIEGERSGLWSEYVRIIRTLRPRYVLVENVAALLVRGMGRVLRDLAACGYDAEWQCIPAAAVGAPHIRDRLWIVAYGDGKRLETQAAQGQVFPKANHSRHSGLTESIPCSPVFREASRQREMLVQADVLGEDYGLPDWMERVKGLGNAVVPQVAEYIGRLVMEHALAA